MDDTFRMLLVGLGVVGVPATVAVLVAIAMLRFGRDLLGERLRAQIKVEYDERLEALKAQLKASADIELERHKHALALEANRLNILRTNLQEKRVSAIAEIYALLGETYVWLIQYTGGWAAPGDSTKALPELVLETHRKFFWACVRQQIYLPRRVADKLSFLNEEIRIASANYTGLRLDEDPDPKRWDEVRNKVHGSIIEALRDLEYELRALMGDSDADVARASSSEA
jgi:hypothetical protein